MARQDRSICPATRGLAAALLFETFVFGPIGAYLQFFHNAWSWMYFVPRERLDAGASLLAVAAYFASLVLGYVLAVTCIRAGSPAMPRLLTIAFLAINAVFSAATVRRLATVATYDEYARGAGRPMWTDPFGVEMALIGVLFFAGLAGCYRWARMPPAAGPTPL